MITPEESDIRNVVKVDDTCSVKTVEPEVVLRTNSTVKRITDADNESWKKYKRISLADQDSGSSTNDEHVTFANCIVHKLRGIKSDRARSIAQYYINWVLFQAEMTNYEEDFEFDGPKEFSLFRSATKKD